MENAVEKTMAWYWVQPILKDTIHFDAGGNDDPQLAFAQILAKNIAEYKRDKTAMENIKKFYDKLTEKLISDKITSLECDYYPCTVLSEIAEECGISESLFSWKTFTYIENGKLFAKSGYGQTVNMIPLLKEDPKF